MFQGMKLSSDADREHVTTGVGEPSQGEEYPVAARQLNLTAPTFTVIDHPVHSG